MSEVNTNYNPLSDWKDKEEFKTIYQERTKKLGMFLCPYFEMFKTKEK